MRAEVLRCSAGPLSLVSDPDERYSTKTMTAFFYLGHGPFSAVPGMCKNVQLPNKGSAPVSAAARVRWALVGKAPRGQHLVSAALGSGRCAPPALIDCRPPRC